MILHEFPNLQWLKAQAEKGFHEARLPDGRVIPVKGWPTVILNVTASNALRDRIKGPLSLFVNLSGESHATAGKHRVRVDADTFFVSNQDQYYSLEVTADAPAELFNIHFGSDFAGQVVQAISTGAEHALDHPADGVTTPSFHNRLYQRSDAFNTLVHELARNPTLATNELAREEHLAALMATVLETEQTANTAMESLPALRSAVREEVFSRLAVAVDYMHSHYEADLSLDELSLVACFSKFHFLRLFRAAYNTTPARYLQQLRLQKARVLLSSTDLSVAGIATATGFGHPNAFIRAFGRAQGMSPTRYRAAVA